MRRLRVATRGSTLARVQTARVVHRLGLHPDEIDIIVVSTTGDRNLDVDLHTMGGVGVFVKEVEDAVLDGRADLAVHSAKDLPARTAPGLVLGALPERGDPRDALVGSTLEALPTGACVATGSVRRRAQLAALRPDLRFAPLRGNIETRLRKATGFDGAVVAAAALDRLDLGAHAAEILEPEILLPQVGQGALAVECRFDDDELIERLAEIDDVATRVAVTAERAFLAELGGGCELPVGALAHVTDGDVVLDALLASHDGRVVLRTSERGDDAALVGVAAARALLDGAGGRMLLEPAS
ncbi:MAG TPA: hydroxymethylbilane synthase [Acidimicrobiia bacterium]|nr:hydroxymethylbilane synthase [Acidimicrobiia bacterium]